MSTGKANLCRQVTENNHWQTATIKHCTIQYYAAPVSLQSFISALAHRTNAVWHWLQELGLQQSEITAKFRKSFTVRDIQWKIRDGRTIGLGAKNYKTVAAPPTKTVEISSKKLGWFVPLPFKIKASEVLVLRDVFLEGALPELSKASKLARL